MYLNDIVRRITSCIAQRSMRDARRTKRTLRVTRKLYYEQTRESHASEARVTRKTFREGIKMFCALRDRRLSEIHTSQIKP